MKYKIPRFREIHHFLKDNNIYNYAAQLSYGLMLAFLPMIMLFNWALRAFFNVANLTPQVIDFIDKYLPQSLTRLILPSVNKVQIDLSADLVNHSLGNVLLLIFILYACTRLMHALIVVSTKLCKIEETRNFFVLWLLSIRNLIFVVVFLGLLLYVFYESRLFIAHFIRVLPDQNLAHLLEWFWNRLVYLYMLISAILMLNWVLAKSPAQPIKFLHALPGTCVIILGWGVLVEIFHIIYSYISYEGIIQIVDSGITIVVTIYLISFILLIGVLINHSIYLRDHSHQPPALNKIVKHQRKF